MRAKYELTVGARLGPGKDNDHDGVALNRVVSGTSAGAEYEADPRQAETLIRDNQLQGANAVATPSTKLLPHQLGQEHPLSMSDFTRFRGQAAHAKRPDVIGAAKEVCRGMSSPTDLQQAPLNRMVRYLRNRTRMVFKFDYQTSTHIDAYADTDWAGCPRSRQSTPGGCIMVGKHAPVQTLEFDSGRGRNELGRGRVLRRSQRGKHWPRDEVAVSRYRPRPAAVERQLCSDRNLQQARSRQAASP